MGATGKFSAEQWHAPITLAIVLRTAGEGAGKSETGRPGRRFLLIQVANDGDFDQDSGSGDIMWCLDLKYSLKFSSVQLLSHVQLFATPWTATCQASLSFTVSWSLLKLMSIELVMPSNHFVLCRPLLLLPSIFPSNFFKIESQNHVKGNELLKTHHSYSLPGYLPKEIGPNYWVLLKR